VVSGHWGSGRLDLLFDWLMVYDLQQTAEMMRSVEWTSAQPVYLVDKQMCIR
jgi:hypothetical protein